MKKVVNEGTFHKVNWTGVHFELYKVGKLWICEQVIMKVPVRGSGSRPDLAIRDYKEQYRRWLKLKK